MLKTTIIAAALLSAAVAAPAMAKEGDALSGFYGGAEIGYGKPKTKLDLTPRTGTPASGSANKGSYILAKATRNNR